MLCNSNSNDIFNKQFHEKGEEATKKKGGVEEVEEEKEGEERRINYKGRNPKN